MGDGERNLRRPKAELGMKGFERVKGSDER